MCARPAPPPAEPPNATTLRISVTDRCNLKCAYCVPDRRLARTADTSPPTLEELAALARWIGRLVPLRKVRITGGEPTMKRGLPALIRMLADAPEVPQVAMTTNGTLLARMAVELADAGLDGVNISLDTLEPRRYEELTRGGRVTDVVAGIQAAIGAGLGPIRLNTVLRRSSWREDVPALLDFAMEHSLEPRFLELMQTGSEQSWSRTEFIPASTVQRWLTDRCGHRIRATGDGRPARNGAVRWRGELMTVGWITPVSDPFCGNCSRLRLDAQGRLRRCLMDPSTLPIGAVLAAGDGPEARRRVETYLSGKTSPEAMEHALPMIDIGG